MSHTILQSESGQTQGFSAPERHCRSTPDVYEFTYSQICFCNPPFPGKPGSEPIVFRVLNGVGRPEG